LLKGLSFLENVINFAGFELCEDWWVEGTEGLSEATDVCLFIARRTSAIASVLAYVTLLSSGIGAGLRPGQKVDAKATPIKNGV
jgi:hypothetical protein